jgi:uncharacterized repeat protein (TIGR02543 family)
MTKHAKTTSKKYLGAARIRQIFVALIFLCSLVSNPIPAKAASPITFSGQELLGRPTDSSITINIVPDEDIDYYYEYGTSTGVYTGQTTIESAAGGEPSEIIISGLQANTQYFYQMKYHAPGDAVDDWVTRAEHSFYTQRASGETFTFTITADSHVNIMLGSGTTWQQTLTNVAGDHPDFEIDLGDTFAMDNVTTVAGAEAAYLGQRQYFDLVGNSAPVFLVAGNHEQQEGWHLDDTGNPATSQPVIGTNAQKKYYLNPVPDGFYSGNTDTYSYLDGDQLHEDYYAWEWGDALFVVIDPFWYTTTKPFTGNTGGGEGTDTGSGDRWDWTLGSTQFNWLKQTLENSTAEYKFIFAHHMVGGSDDYVRGGANPANLVEWGGYNEAGTVYEWETKRPVAEWGSEPVHQILVNNNVSAFFHGHDHQYAYEKRDGVVYQALPSAGFSGNGFNIYSTGSGYTVQALPSPGHLRVTVSPSETTVDYIATTNGAINYSYTIDAASSDPTYVLTTAVSPSGGGTIDPTAGAHTYDENEVVGVTATANPGYTFSGWSGACSGTGSCSVTMDADKTVTANFSLIAGDPITFTGSELLGRPTDTSVDISVVPDQDIAMYYQYGITSGAYTDSTSIVNATGGQPQVVTIDGLTPDTKYYYQMLYSTDGGGSWATRSEHSFHTQRAEGSTFTFDVTTDSHIDIMLGNESNWTSTLNGVSSDNADFLIDLGDTFAMDNGTSSVTLGDIAAAEQVYKDPLPYFNMISGSTPIYLVAGNHEQQEAWHLQGTLANSLPVMGKNAEKKFYLNPLNNAFYSGDTSTMTQLSGDHTKQDYYAWEWGDALFVVISPFWTTTTKPYTTTVGGGETDTTGSGDRWDWTLGLDQYNWLKTTLEGSSAKYKFVFAHQIVGGNGMTSPNQVNYGHGGVDSANLVEWGGYNVGGTVWGWDTERPGWGSQPIRQMMEARGVTAFFHGHDHQFAYESLNGMVYQAVPSASFSGSFGNYTTGGNSGNTIWADSSEGPGHLKVTVGPSQTTVDFIRYNASTPAYTYTMAPTGGPNHLLTVNVSPEGAGTTSPEVGSHTYMEGAIATVTATPTSGYIFDHWSGDCTGTSNCSVTMDTDKTVTAVFSEYVPSPVVLDGAVSSGTADGVSSINIAHTTGTGANRLMLVGVSANSYNSAQTISSVTFTPSGGSAIALSPVGSVENESGRLAAIYSLLDPPSGVSGTVTVTFSGSVSYGIIAGVANFAGVDQTDPLDDFVSAVGTETSTMEVDVPADPNDVIFDTTFLGAATLPSLTVGSGQTQQWNATIDRARGAASIKQAIATTTQMSWTPSGGSTSYYWAIGAVPINPVPDGTTYTLTMAVDPEGSGTTTPAIGNHTYAEGAAINITATPNSGYTFDHWSGACTGADPCSVTMDGDKTVTAHFTPTGTTYNLTVTVDPDSSGTTNPAAGVHTYASGTIVDVTATPEAGWEFDQWSGACTGTGACQVTMDADKSVTASFVELEVLDTTITANPPDPSNNNQATFEFESNDPTATFVCRLYGPNDLDIYDNPCTSPRQYT